MKTETKIHPHRQNIKNKMKKKIEEDEDFVYCPRQGNSLRKVINSDQFPPGGLDDEKIARFLMTTPKEVKRLFESAIKKIRLALKVEMED